MQNIPCALACVFAVTATCGVRAGEAGQPFEQLETKYLFGFTTGADIGAEGEKEISAQTAVKFGKRQGSYAAFEHRLEYETTVSQFMQLEFALLGSSHHIKDVPGLDNISRSNFRGLSGEIRYLLIEKTPNSPFGLTLSFEPSWARLEDSTGERVSQWEFETKLQADYEFLPNHVYGAFNLIYEPEIIRDLGASGWERESTLGASAALSGRLSSKIVAGAELGYFRKYGQGLAFNRFEGDALYVGPAMYVQLTKKAFLSAAYSTQVAGHSVENLGVRLDLDHFARHRAKLKVGFEF